jgi:beta-glucosidase-like glycosyl hydrolase
MVSVIPNLPQQKLILRRPFADAVRAGAGSIMCSYNRINNSYGSQNSWTLNYLLKNELDFQGFGMAVYFFNMTIR